MKILAIETSCDETAISLLEANSGFENPKFKVLSNALNSQIELHKEYGGVYPSLAKREHTKNLTPLLLKVMEEVFGNTKLETLNDRREPENHSNVLKKIRMVLEREPELFEQFARIVLDIKKPDIDYIAVTEGPGLEPALWVGINFAKALSLLWNIPLIPINHMEGHILSPLLNKENKITFPSLALLISGGHTELVLMKDWYQYEVVGETQDDAVGEAFDKTARMLGLPYPGGPEISKLAKETRNGNYEHKHSLPKPMLKDNTCHFSFSGLKTAVLYRLKELNITDEIRKEFARELEDTIVEILIKKTEKALDEHGAKSLIIGGGVIANAEIRKAFLNLGTERNLPILIPEKEVSTDNAIMIGIAGYFRALKNPSGFDIEKIGANGNLSL